MDFLRTPNERFTDLPDFPFQPQYASVADGEGGELRMHYLDEGPPDAPVVLLLHGEPSWSYLYRKMIPPVVEAGFRCVVPDLIGFGRSDKPTKRTDYTYGRHVAWLVELLFDRLDLWGITLFCQDWGGLLGLRVVAQHRERFASVLASNTILPTGEQETPEAFMAWLELSHTVPEFDTGAILQFASTTELTSAEVDAYRAPFPDEAYKAGARIFPALVPIRPNQDGAADNTDAWLSLRRFDRPFLTIFGSEDLVTAGGERRMIDEIPGAAGLGHHIVDDAGHFIQEDAPVHLAEHLIRLAQGVSR